MIAIVSFRCRSPEPASCESEAAMSAKVLIAIMSLCVFGLCSMAMADGLATGFAPSVPEPATIGLLAIGAAIFVVKRRKAKRS